jgi:Glycosyltransferases involved in cell wall biogenesis
MQINSSPEYIIVIPSLNPNQRFLDFMIALETEHKRNNNLSIAIIVVNDGTSTELLHFYDEANEIYPFMLLTHATNLGKGRAMKTAINHILNHYPNTKGVLFADSDGQHLAKDCFNCINAATQHPDALILGVRDFSDENVPAKNKAGNIITRNVFHFLCGIKVSDSQTGLRVIPHNFLRSLMNIQGERFEFEMHMLLATKDYHIPIIEVPITTVYEQKENYSSHFNPITDSFKIYSIFIKFIFSGISSFLVDSLLFLLFIHLLRFGDSYILLATIVARFFSSIYNYFLNQKIVFKSNNGINSLFKYYSLAVVQAVISGICVTYFYKVIPFSELAVKIPVDLLLFLFSYRVQQSWVFKGNTKV